MLTFRFEPNAPLGSAGAKAPGRMRSLVVVLALMATGLVVAVGATPAAAVVVSRAYVSNFDADTVSVIDTTSNVVVDTIRG